jgi:hypothetical protein
MGQLVSAGGGWVGGGGELIKDGHNPWFLNSVKDVTYCVLLDQTNFGVNDEVVNRSIEKAIQFWKFEFSQATVPSYETWGSLALATQNFHKVECSESTDITFQFGVLNQEQSAYLRKPQDFAAITVRTNYDQKTLHGRGFVYVSPEKGPLAYNSEGVIGEAWSLQDSKLLDLTLIHELGHVFGLSHMGNLGTLMSEGFVETILAWAKIDSNGLFEDQNFFSLRERIATICPEGSVLERWRRVFALSPTDKCVQFVFKHDLKSPLYRDSKMIVLASAEKGGPTVNLGSVDLKMVRFFPIHTSLIWLPEVQSFTAPQDKAFMVGSNIIGSILVSVSKQGRFVSRSGESYDLQVGFEQGSGLITILSSSPKDGLLQIL